MLPAELQRGNPGRSFQSFAGLGLSEALLGSIQSYPQIAQITPDWLVSGNLWMTLTIDIV
jgi:hypothetical protein